MGGKVADLQTVSMQQLTQQNLKETFVLIIYSAFEAFKLIHSVVNDEEAISLVSIHLVICPAHSSSCTCMCHTLLYRLHVMLSRNFMRTMLNTWNYEQLPDPILRMVRNTYNNQLRHSVAALHYNL